MLSEWLNSLIRFRRAPANSSRHSLPHFRCSSFKDIHSLLRDDDSLSHPRSHRLSPVFHRIRRVRRFPPPHSDSLTGGSDFVVYFTSLSVVRRTFDDCLAVRSILRSFRVPIDERDLSMDSTFRRELVDAMGSSTAAKKRVALPAVFVGGRYIGGAEEIKRLKESGELHALIRESPFVVDARDCEGCGGLGFVVCDRCHGSTKIYGKCGFMECSSCNINGLIRCSSCRPLHRCCT